MVQWLGYKEKTENQNKDPWKEYEKEVESFRENWSNLLLDHCIGLMMGIFLLL